MFDVLRAQEVKIGDEQEVKPSTEAFSSGVVMCHGRVMS